MPDIGGFTANVHVGALDRVFEYELSTDVKSFFEEQDPALDRVAADFAARLVAAVTENY